MTALDDDLQRVAQQVETLGRRLAARGDVSTGEWLAYRQARCVLLATVALAEGTSEAIVMAEVAQEAVRELEATEAVPV